MKSILVPVDFSEPSSEAFRLAVDLASRYQAVLKLLHVQGVPMTDPYAEVATAEVDAMLEERLHERMQRMIKTLAEESEPMAKLVEAVEFRTVVRTGFAAGEISRLAREEDADWIVMGTRGAGGLSGALFGSVTAAVVGRSDRPILAVPHGVAIHPFRHIACALDSPLSEGNLLQELDQLAGRFEASLTFLHVVEEQHVSTSGVIAGSLSAYRSMQGHGQAKGEVLSGHDVEEALASYCDDNEVDLLVMVREHHPFLQKLIHRSMTRRLAMHAQVPLLIFPPQ
jgi:nucleotide-binding universal stress UspA family protein